MMNSLLTSKKDSNVTCQESTNRFKLWPTKTLTVCVLLLLLVINLPVAATSNDAGELIGLEAAIEIGLEENSTLQDSRREIENLQRSIDRLQASQGWNLDLWGDYSYYSDDDRPGMSEIMDNGSVDDGGNGGYDSISIGLDSSRELAGFYLNPALEITGMETKELSDIDFEDDVELSLSLRSDLYPRLPTQSERELRILEDNFLGLQENYQKEKVQQQLSWLNDYLELLRLQERLEIQDEYLAFTEENLVRTEKRQEIGEAGMYEYREAEIDNREAQIAYQRQLNILEQKKQDFYRELGLSPHKQIKLTRDDAYLKESKQFLQEKEKEMLTDEKLLKKNLLDNSIDIKSLTREIARAQTELEWVEKEARPELVFNGSVDVPDGEWQLGLSATFNLYDGGLSKMGIEEKKIKLADLQEDYQELRESLLLQVERRLAELELKREEKEIAGLKLKNKQMETEKSDHERKKGIISEREYRQLLVAEKDVAVDLQAAKDELLMEQLYLLEFTGCLDFRKLK